MKKYLFILLTLILTFLSNTEVWSTPVDKSMNNTMNLQISDSAINKSSKDWQIFVFKSSKYNKKTQMMVIDSIIQLSNNYPKVIFGDSLTATIIYPSGEEHFKWVVNGKKMYITFNKYEKNSIFTDSVYQTTFWMYRGILVLELKPKKKQGLIILWK